MNKKILALPLTLLTVALSACGPTSTVDNTIPTVTLATIASPVTTPGTLTVSASASDNVAVKQVEFYLDDATIPFETDTSEDANHNYTASLQWTAAQNGQHTIHAVAVDTNDNRSTKASQTINVNVDNVKPVVIVTGLPTSTVTSPSTYTISYSATDNVGVTSINGVLTRNGSTTALIDQTTTAASGTLVSIPLTAAQNGTYTLTLTATDAAGNVGTTTHTIVVDIPTGTTPIIPNDPMTPNDPTRPSNPTTLDTEAPRVSITVPGGTLTTPGDYEITINLSDNVGVTSVSGYVESDALGRVNLSNLSTSGGKATIPVSKAFNGNNTIYIFAKDAAGNTGTAQASVRVAIP